MSMNLLPLVSILIPVYNRETMIGACIESALEQTVTDIEIIVVDNASSDNTWNICKLYAQRDSRIKIFRNKENLGPVQNWKCCIDKAKGKYGKILFSDDLIDAQFLEKTISVLDDPNIGLVFSRVCIGEQEWQGTIYYEYFDTSRVIDVRQYLKDCIIGSNLPLSPGCALFRLDDLRKNLRLTITSPIINDFEEHGAGPDLLLFLLTAVNYKKVAYINETLVFFRSHSGSITINDKSRYLQKCYFQTRVWFATQYQPGLLDELLIRGWLLEIKDQKNMIGYKNFVDQYLWNDKRKIKFVLIGKVLKNFILSRIKTNYIDN